MNSPAPAGLPRAVQRTLSILMGVAEDEGAPNARLHCAFASWSRFRKEPMPTYEYRCTDCGRELEVQQRFSDDALTVCPTCQGALNKVFSPVGVVFKGSGFYATDSRKSHKSTRSEASVKPADKPKTDAPKADKPKADKAKAAASSSTSG